MVHLKINKRIPFLKSSQEGNFHETSSHRKDAQRGISLQGKIFSLQIRKSRPKESNGFSFSVP